METQQQTTTHSIDSLIKFVKELNKKSLNPLIEELQHEPSPIAATAVTYAHGSHSGLKTGDQLVIYPADTDTDADYVPNGITVSVKAINLTRDFMLLESDTTLCKKRLKLIAPRQGVDYIQIGLSGRKQSLVINRKGVISSDDFQNNNGFMLGSAGSSPGDSGAGIFHVSSLALYGIGTAAMKKVTTDFQKATNEEIGSALNRLSLVASQPVLSYICPSVLFTGKKEPPYKRTKSEEIDFQCSAY